MALHQVIVNLLLFLLNHGLPKSSDQLTAMPQRRVQLWEYNMFTTVFSLSCLKLFFFFLFFFFPMLGIERRASLTLTLGKFFTTELRFKSLHPLFLRLGLRKFGLASNLLCD